MRRISCVVCPLVSVLLNAVPIYSSTLVSTQESNGITIQTIDPATGQVLKNVGIPNGRVHPADIASDLSALDSRIWAVTDDAFGTSGFELVGIDAHLASIVSRVPLNPQRQLRTLVIDPTDGSFYGTTTTDLFRIDKSTGAITSVGLTNHLVDRGLAFDREGNLFGIGSQGRTLVRLDRLTGAAELIANLPARIEDIAIRPEDGAMFGVGYNGDYQLHLIDAANGALTVIGDSVGRPSGLAFIYIPEPSSVAMAVIVVLTALGRHEYRRRVAD